MNNKTDRVRADIAAFGWHVVKVLGEADLPEFAYTVGLTKSYRHPEVIMFGAPLDLMHKLLNVIGSAVKGGTRFETGRPYSSIIKRFDCCFQEFPKSQYSEHLGCALGFYEHDKFSALQCFWPDAAGLFPWDPGADRDSVTLQPCFYREASS